MAPMSRACVASQSRWEASRFCSVSMVRMYLARRGTSMPNSFSTPSAQPRLLLMEAT